MSRENRFASVVNLYHSDHSILFLVEDFYDCVDRKLTSAEVDCIVLSLSHTAVCSRLSFIADTMNQLNVLTETDYRRMKQYCYHSASCLPVEQSFVGDLEDRIIGISNAYEASRSVSFVLEDYYCDPDPCKLSVSRFSKLLRGILSVARIRDLLKSLYEYDLIPLLTYEDAYGILEVLDGKLQADGEVGNRGEIVYGILKSVDDGIVSKCSLLQHFGGNIVDVVTTVIYLLCQVLKSGSADSVWIHFAAFCPLLDDVSIVRVLGCTVKQPQCSITTKSRIYVIDILMQIQQNQIRIDAVHHFMSVEGFRLLPKELIRDAFPPGQAWMSVWSMLNNHTSGLFSNITHNFDLVFSKDTDVCIDVLSDAEHKSSCKICYQYPIQTVITDCGHSYMCLYCSSRIIQSPKISQNCAICRAEISSIVKVYHMGD
jgi:hypothetical protein